MASFIFGGDTGETPESIARKRQIAQLMAARVAGPTPRNIGEGIGLVGAALLGRSMNRRADKSERAGREQAEAMMQQIFGGGVGPAGAGMGAPVSPPGAAAVPGGSRVPAPAPVAGAASASPGAGWSPGMAEAAINRSELPPGLMPAVWQAESGMDPQAVSEKGAVGTGQILPATARDPGYGVPTIFDVGRSMGKPVPDESDATLQALLRDPDVNKAFSTAYMTAMHREQGGDLDRTLASYNAGPGAVAQHGGVPPFAETEAYIPAVRASMTQASAGASPAGGAALPGAMAPGGRMPAPAAGVDPRIAQALSNPFLSPGERAVLGAMLEQQMAASAPISPYQQQQLGMTQAQMTEERRQFEAEQGLAERKFQLDQAKAGSTEDLREYERYAAQAQERGEQPMPFLDYQLAVKKAGAGGTTVSVGGQKIPDALVTAAIKSSDTADALFAQVDELEIFRDLAEEAETGFWRPVTLPLAKALQDIGINVDPGVPLAEILTAQQNQMALRLRNPDSGFGLTGNTSDRDIQFLKDSVAGLGKTREGNLAILTVMAAKQRRQANLEMLKSEYIFEKGNLAGWDKVRRGYIEANPLFSDEERAMLESLGVGPKTPLATSRAGARSEPGPIAPGAETTVDGMKIKRLD